MKPQQFVVIISTFTLTFLLSPFSYGQENKSSSAKKPNIVLINMDDMGYGDVETYGGIGYTTPNITKLASEGMRSTEFYSASSICTPSRAALMTGAYPNRVGLPFVLWPHSKRGLSQKEETIASLLKKVGYVTGIVGKWHLGDAKKFLPLQHGFDYFYGLPYSNDMWPRNYEGDTITRSDPEWDIYSAFPELPLIEGNKVIDTIADQHDQNMLTTWWTEKSVDFINRHKDEPFFLYLAHNMVHVPLGVSDKFRGKSEQGMFGDVMMEIDWSVGQVMKALKENRLRKNTLVIFTADNGPWLVFGNHGGSAGGLRNGKTTTWDGGHKEPAIMSWPGVIPKGTVNNKLASNMDILPTLAKITGAPLPEKKIDGVNILPLLKGKDVSPRDHLYYYYIQNKLEAVRQGKWKLVFPHKYDIVKKAGMDGYRGEVGKDSTGLALYNLRRDPGERFDVKEHNPEVVKKLKELGEKARKDLGDELHNRPGKNRREPGWLNKNK